MDFHVGTLLGLDRLAAMVPSSLPQEVWSWQNRKVWAEKSRGPLPLSLTDEETGTQLDCQRPRRPRLSSRLVSRTAGMARSGWFTGCVPFAGQPRKGLVLTTSARTPRGRGLTC